MLFTFCKLTIFVTCGFLYGISAQVSSAPSYYTAGVVEFRPIISGMTSLQMVQEHLQAYIEIINSAEANNTDIIVFPEGTLNNILQSTYVPDASEAMILCDHQQSANSYTNNNNTDTDTDTTTVYADFLMQLSCAARNVRKYLVINLTEKENCTAMAVANHDPRPCAPNGLNAFNTNVVFDREGRIISRYRKVNLYTEAKNTTLQPEFGMFDTDFGVRFGHFICFDILFYTPAEELVVRYGIKDFIFTSWFYSELPFLTALQVQEAWAWGNNVNLLAAGASSPQGGPTGSGIYAGSQGKLVSVMVGGNGIRKLLVAQVPITNSSQIQVERTESIQTEHSSEPLTDVKLMKNQQMSHFTSELLNFTKEQNVIRQLCNKDFCCQFDISTTQAKTTTDTVSYMYRIGAFKGQRTYEKEMWSDIQICALYACTNESVISCGEMFDGSASVHSNVIFNYVHIAGNFEKTEKVLIMPKTINDRLYTLEAESVDWKVVDDGHQYKVHFNLTSPCCNNDNLLTFGIYANYFDRSAAASITQYATSLPLLLYTTSIVALFIGLSLW